MASKKLDLLGILPPSFAEQLHMSMNTKIEYKTTNPTLAIVFRGSSCSHEVAYRSFVWFFLFFITKGDESDQNQYDRHEFGVYSLSPSVICLNLPRTGCLFLTVKLQDFAQ
jgi:hypothetical protein